MLFKGPIIVPNKAPCNLPTERQAALRDNLLTLYCEITEAKRILLAFCTYSMLTGKVGRTSVQVPFSRLDFPDNTNYWCKLFNNRHKRRHGVMLDVNTVAVTDIRVEIVKPGCKVGAFLDQDLEKLEEKTVRPVFKCEVSAQHQESLGGVTHVWVDASHMGTDSGSVALAMAHVANRRL